MRKDLRVIPKHPEPAPQAWGGPTFFINPGENETGLWEVARKLWRRKWLVAGGTLAFIAAGAAVTAMMTPRYGAESQVLIGIQTPRVLNVDSILSGLTANSETVQSEAYIVTSRAVAEKVARRLDLDKNPEFNAALRPKPAFDLSRMLGIDAIKSWLSKPQRQPVSDGVVTRDQRKWDGVVSALLSRVDVTPLNRSHVLSIDTQSEDPQLAARMANTFADVYIEQQLKTKQKATTDADHWLDTRIAQLKQQVQKSDKAVEDYRRKHGLYETKSDTVIAQQLAELNREMLAAQNARVEAESRYHQASTQLKNADSMESLPAVLDSPLIQTLRGQQSQLEQKSAQLASLYTAKHPLRRDIAAQIKEIKGKIRAEAQRIVDGLQHQAQMADDRFNRVKRQMAALQSKMGEANEETVTLHQLQREAEANRTMLVALLQRSKETVDQQSLLVPDARVISKADVPLSPSFPPSTLILVLAAFAGLGCSVLLALLLEGIDQTFRAREDVEHETGLPVLALVPSVTKARQVSADPRAPFWESLHMLNTRLSLETDGGGAPKSVMFTSAVPREGKTSLSTAYARLLAQEGQRVVILELDWKRPSLHKALGQQQRAGLAELLHGFVTPEEAVYRDPDSGLHAIFAGNGGHIAQSGVWLARLRLLLGTLSRHYDVIVLDTAPASVTPEILHVSRLVEQTVFVVKWGSTARHTVLSELRNLHHAGASLAGVVLSQVDFRRYRRYSYSESDYRRRRLALGAG